MAITISGDSPNFSAATITAATITTGTVTTLNAPSGVLATQNGMTGVAKAWINFNGTAGTIRANFNVGSITKNATGDYTLNFTTSMPDGNYSVSGVPADDGTLVSAIQIHSTSAAMTTSSVRIQVVDRTGAVVDRTVVCVTINGN